MDIHKRRRSDGTIVPFRRRNDSKEGVGPEAALRGIVKRVQSNLIDPKAAASTPMTAHYDSRYIDDVKQSGLLD